jgi:hypothetical protein
LTPGPGQLAIKTEVTLTTICPTERQRREFAATLGLYALCRPVVGRNASGQDEVSIAVDRIEIETIEPAAFESIVECLLLGVLRGVLGQVRLPVDSLNLGAFAITLVAGPLAETDQVKVRGNV